MLKFPTPIRDRPKNILVIIKLKCTEHFEFNRRMTLENYKNI